MHALRLKVLIICAMFICGGPAGAVLVDKILAVVNGETLTLQDFEDHLALRTIYQPSAAEVDRHAAFQRFVDQVLLRQEAVRTRIVQVGEAEVNHRLGELAQQAEQHAELLRVMHERGLSWRDVRTWLRHQLIVGAFIDRRVRLFVRVAESQIVRYYEDNRQAIGEPFSEAVHEQIQRLLTEQQVNARLTELLEELRKKGSLDFPP
jgi:peptidyl-prolyl cis-trans isomerase SurA